jgi:CelD/BcsL family acetyltransferase involved in cellulose biosynthesis
MTSRRKLHPSSLIPHPYNPRRNMRVIQTFAELEALAPAWDALWRRDPNATPFQSPHWLLPWWRQFAGGGELAAVWDDGVLLPAYVLRDEDSDESLGMLLGTGISDYLDLLGNDAAGALAQLLSIDCQLWDLQNLRPSSPLLTAALPDGWSDNAEEMEPCPVLSLASPDTLLSTHARKKLRYYRRALARDAEVAYESATAENLDELLRALYDLHARRWQRRNLPGVLADDAIQAFHAEAARRMLGAGALRMYAMRRNGTIIAVLYGFAHHGVTYYYLSGYDPDFERLSIGNVIVAHAIDEAIREGAHTFDFLRGAEEYKYSWGATDRMNRRRQFFRA